jgi:hypothetical protein
MRVLYIHMEVMMKQKILVGAILLAVSGVAVSMPKSDFFLNANVGTGGMDTPNSATSYISQSATSLSYNSKSDGGFIWGIGGGVMFTINPKVSLGGEVAYENFKNNTYSIRDASGVTAVDSTFEYSGYPIDILAIAAYHFNPLVAIDLKAGVAYEHQELVQSGAEPGAGTYNNTAWLPKLGTDFNYYFNNHLMTSIGYLHGFGSSVTPTDRNAVVSTNEVNLGVTYII